MDEDRRTRFIVHEDRKDYDERKWNETKGWFFMWTMIILFAIALYFILQANFGKGFQDINSIKSEIHSEVLYNATIEEQDICWEACETIPRPYGPTDNIVRITSSVVLIDGKMNCKCEKSRGDTGVVYISFDEAIIKSQQEYPIYAERVKKWLDCTNTVNVNCGRAPIGYQDIYEREGWEFKPKLY